VGALTTSRRNFAIAESVIQNSGGFGIKGAREEEEKKNAKNT
jgi:hypothetical protein